MYELIAQHMYWTISATFISDCCRTVTSCLPNILILNQLHVISCIYTCHMTCGYIIMHAWRVVILITHKLCNFWTEHNSFKTQTRAATDWFGSAQYSNPKFQIRISFVYLTDPDSSLPRSGSSFSNTWQLQHTNYEHNAAAAQLNRPNVTPHHRRTHALVA